MFSFIRFCGYFIFSTLILSIPINSKPLFYSIQKYSTPVTTTIIQKINNLYSRFIESNKEEGIKSKIDKISSSLSSTIRDDYKKSLDYERRRQFFKSKTHVHHHEESHGHNYQEREMLRKILERE